MYYIYILRLSNDKLYVGYSNDLKRRVGEHKDGKSKYTKSFRPLELIYYEAYKSKSDAKYREKNLKRFAQAHSRLKMRIKNSLQ